MDVSDVTSPVRATGGRRYWALWGGLVVLVGIVALLLTDGGMCALAASSWRELRHMPLPTLALIAAGAVRKAIWQASPITL